MYHEKRGGDKAGSGCDIGANNEAVYKDIIEMGDAFEALSDGERVETLLGLPEDGGCWFRGSMVREATLGNADGCVINGGAYD